MTLIKTGTVKFPPGKPFPNKFKQGKFQQTLVLSMDDGSEEKLYFEAGRQPHSSLTKQQTIQLLYEQQENGKVYRKLKFEPSSTSSSTSTLNKDHKIAIANFINEQGDILAYCLNTAQKKFEGKVFSEESFRTLATTLYLAAQKHYF